MKVQKDDEMPTSITGLLPFKYEVTISTILSGGWSGYYYGVVAGASIGGTVCSTVIQYFQSLKTSYAVSKNIKYKEGKKRIFTIIGLVAQATAILTFAAVSNYLKQTNCESQEKSTWCPFYEAGSGGAWVYSLGIIAGFTHKTLTSITSEK